MLAKTASALDAMAQTPSTEGTNEEMQFAWVVLGLFVFNDLYLG